MDLIAKNYHLKHKPIIKEEFEKLVSKGITPLLHCFLVGNNAASIIYTNNKKRMIESLGGKCEIIKLDESISEDVLVETIKSHSKNELVHGIFVQLPLPVSLKHVEVDQLIPADKDIDAFHKDNIFALFTGNTDSAKSFLPCTPSGIIELLKFYNIEIARKNIVIIGRSLIVGKPLSMLLTNLNATVTLCHSKTANIKDFTSNADIIISAVGIPRYFTKDYLSRDDQVLIDVAINHDKNGKLCGDMDYDNLKDHCKAITPVPGGVGPMTIMGLVNNLLVATKRKVDS